MMENGPAFAARKVLEMDEDLLTLGICRLVRVVRINTPGLHMDNDWQTDHEGFPESISVNPLSREVADYRVIAKDDSSWDAILGLLSQLNESDYDTLSRLLDRCDRVSEECVIDNGGLLKKLSGDEMLEEDVAAERENRKEAQGFVTPSSAAFFLGQSRSASIKRIIAEEAMPHGARLYIKAAEVKKGFTGQSPAQANESSGRTCQGIFSFIETLRNAEVLPDREQKKIGYNGDDFSDIHLPLITAIRAIKESDPDLYAQRIVELSFLSNTLIAGCGFRGRAFNPKEAAEAALSVCNLGSEHLLEIGVVRKKNHLVCESISDLIKTNHLVRLFQVGWKILFDSIVLDTAKSVLGFINRLKDEISDPEQKLEIARMAQVLRSGISSGRPWICYNEMDYLQVFLDGETSATIGELIQEYPTFTEAFCKKGGLRLSPFIYSHAHIRTFRHFIEDVFRE